MVSIFLSHSSANKIAVRKLKDDLERSGVHVWLDESDIRVGEGIIDKVEEGLAKSDFVAVWLTKDGVKSGWVQQEWKSRWSAEIGTGQTTILPLLAEECKMPYWLKDKKYADFRNDYSSGLKELLKILRSKQEKVVVTEYISDRTRDFLKNLSKAEISLPLREPIKIVDTLKKLPRSGKKIRLHDFRPGIRIRSVYEHILSIAHTADALFNIAKHNIGRHDALELARLIAFHELNEVILGDIPAYTELRQSKIERSSLSSAESLLSLDPDVRESRTNEFIAMFLGKREMTALDAVNKRRENRDPVYQFFHVIDKIDPLIATWRYLHEYRGMLGKRADGFLDRMADFFANPMLIPNATKRGADPRIIVLLEMLKHRELAQAYYMDSHFFSRSDIEFGFEGNLIKSIIEDFEAPNL